MLERPAYLPVNLSLDDFKRERPISHRLGKEENVDGKRVFSHKQFLPLAHTSLKSRRTEIPAIVERNHRAGSLVDVVLQTNGHSPD